jgi:pimeloyl-ACP methyl ester carboxylesterase
MPGENRTLATEATAMAEYAALLVDPVYYGVGVPRGDGRAVAVLPGLFGNDFYLRPLRTWLGRIGYRPVRSALAVNAGCPERLSRTVAAEVEREAGSVGPVAIIGHSRGGILAWALANRMGSRASHVILLGSPAALLADAVRAGGLASQPAMSSVSARVRGASERSRRLLDPDCEFPACGCPFVAALAMPLDGRTQVAAIVSEDDAIVPAEAARAPGHANHVVRGSHSGLAANGAVYRHLGALLASRPAGGGTP